MNNESKCEQHQNCGNQQNSNNFVFIVVLYILLVIILGAAIF